MLCLIAGCTEDSPDNNPVINDPVVLGYNTNESSQCMTLASLAYVSENNTSYIKDSLIIQLADTSYATDGKWTLDWGPALNSDNSNMMYVVKNSNLNPPRYAIAIRGTDWCFPTNWEEDILVWRFVKYPFGSSQDSVAEGTLVGLNELLSMRDPATNKTLLSYLNSITGNNFMYITGHSLGGALATILTAWFMDNGFTSKFKLKSYTFAAPSIGNTFFVSHFASQVNSTGSESHRVINPKDLVPRFWSELDSVIYQQIPTSIPLSVGSVIIAIEGYFKYYNIIYEHVGTRTTLSTLFPSQCGNGGTLDDYECWVAFEHSSNTYLILLNAPATNVGYVQCDWAD